MTRYKGRPTQEEKILSLLRKRSEKGVYVWEFMLPKNKGGLGIAQYNARIWGLRQRGHIIENKEPGHFVLVKDAEEPEPKRAEITRIYEGNQLGFL